MALVPFDQEPQITDTILLTITTPDTNGCLTADPYKVDSVTVYYVERDFLGQNYGEYTKTVVDPALQAKLDAAQAELCAVPTADNLAKVTSIQAEINSKSQPQTFYYKDRQAVKVIGSDNFPAWLSTDTTDAPLTQTATGTFTFEWEPDGGIREGDYFLCWTWTPLPAGSKLSAHAPFYVAGDPKAVITIPTHVTPAEKYPTLLERYLPDMYKMTLTDNDQTPIILDNLNQSIAKGFSFLEDLANQVIDLFDANALHESLLIYQSNLFNIKLKSSDPTLWRRQIKEAVPLFKKKGTLAGLTEAFAQAGMDLTKFTQYWQLVSPYTWVDVFTVSDSNVFTLTQPNVVLPTNSTNFGLWLKRAGATVFQAVPLSYVNFDTAEDGAGLMIWVANNLSNNAVDLHAGDQIKVMYQYNAIPDANSQQLENYIRSLPLADQRDENAQQYPLKNWNVRLIAEDDPLFDVLVPVRQPFADPLVFGYRRTEFAYSENIYNMEEYNGSTRPSLNPCDIDKDFVDPCGACLSSIYSVDIGVGELSNDRMLEAMEILKEYTPFHAQVHSLNFAGEVNEFVQPPTETVEMLVTVDFSQFVLSGESNPIFTRFMPGGLQNAIITRQDLTDEVTVLSNQTGLGYNDHVAFVAPDNDLQVLGIAPEAHVLEVLAPSSNAGTYSIIEYSGRTAKVSSTVLEPVDESAFTFNLSNIPYGNSYSNITQDNEYQFSDPNNDFSDLSIRTLWDMDHTPNYTGGTWTVSLPAYSSTPYQIIKVVGGVLYLKGDANLPTTNTTNISYTLTDDLNNVVTTGTQGQLDVTLRGLVDLQDPEISDIHEFVINGDYLYYNGTEYKVLEFDGSNFWIEGYADGDAVGVSVQVRRRLVNQGIGYFGYTGMHLTTATDLEAQFGMIDGSNPPPEDQQTDNSLFKENFLFQINSDFYKIASINKTEVVLVGRDQDWTTLKAGGTSVTYNLVHFPTKQVSVGFTVFDQLNRNGQDPVIREIYSTVDSTTAIVALSTSPSTPLEANVSQEEGISFTIEHSNGEVFEGEL